MDQEIKDKWLKALRGGRYKQVRGFLKRTTTSKGIKSTGYCCLGVLCRVVEPNTKWESIGGGLYEFHGKDTHLPKSVRDKLKLTPFEESQYWLLPVLNDTHRKSFKELADFIEKKL
jgi:hypothetical protein